MGPEQLWIGKLPDKPNKPNFFFYKLTRKCLKHHHATSALVYFCDITIPYWFPIQTAQTFYPQPASENLFFLFKVAERKRKEAFFTLLQSSYAQGLCEKLIRKVKQVYQPKNIHALFLVFTVKKLKIPGRLIQYKPG